jgi:hypothetical protein
MRPENAIALVATVNSTPPFAILPIPATRATLIDVAEAKARSRPKATGVPEGRQTFRRAGLLVSDSQACQPSRKAVVTKQGLEYG